MTAPRYLRELAGVIADEQRKAAMKIKPLAEGEIQCHEYSAPGLGATCCLLTEGHVGPHDFADPILGIV